MSSFLFVSFCKLLSAANIALYSTGIVETALHDNGFVLLRLILTFFLLAFHLSGEFQSGFPRLRETSVSFRI